jgi:hypothetical protein
MTSPYQLGYCTNVHAGADLEATLANLEQHARAVRRRFCPDTPLGIGLWLSARAATGLRDPSRLDQLADWLRQAGLVPFTMNGFPYGDFHRPIVKHDVYHPTWCEAARVDYTLQLIEILDRLLPAGREGSISTLPLLWGTPRPDSETLARAAANLRTVADQLWRLEQERGRLISVCLEPEPGCVLQRSEDVVRFFRDHLLSGGDEQRVRRYLRVCHDMCHAAVMFEDQQQALARYAAAGISVGKVQVSAAVELPLDQLAPEQRGEAVRQLRAFAEDRYLHQTTIQAAPDRPAVFFEDLPRALDCSRDPHTLTGRWRTHFHVPIYLQQFGLLRTTQPAILECLQGIQQHPADVVQHFEVETYAWGVLPDHLQQPLLADGIAAELQWLQQAWDMRTEDRP